MIFFTVSFHFSGFYLPASILFPTNIRFFFPVWPVQPDKLRYVERYEIAVFLFRLRFRYKKFRPIRYGIHSVCPVASIVINTVSDPISVCPM